MPIRQNIAYSFCFTGAETDIHKIKDDSKIDREKNIDRRGPRQNGTDCPIDTFLTPLLSGCRLPLRAFLRKFLSIRISEIVFTFTEKFINLNIKFPHRSLTASKKTENISAYKKVTDLIFKTDKKMKKW